MKEYTLAVIKPDAVEKGLIKDILNRLSESGLIICGYQDTVWTLDVAQQFYAEHKDQPFFDELTKFMSSGPLALVVLEGENAVARLRTSVLAIRKEFADPNVPCRNAIHGSDSYESAIREIGLVVFGGLS